MNPITRHTLSFNRSRGFSLMEILVTVIVLSIGLLGLAGLQLSGLRYNHSAYLRSQATLMTNDILDRMNANRAAARAGNYDIAVGTSASSPGASCNGSTTDTCTPTQMAIYDLNDWKQNLATILPAGDGSVSRSIGAGNQVLATIIIQWDDSHGKNTAIQLPVEVLI